MKTLLAVAALAILAMWLLSAAVKWLGLLVIAVVVLALIWKAISR